MTISNTLTNLEGRLYSAVDIVSREMVGLANSVSINSAAARAAKGDSVLVPVSNSTSGVDISPAMSAPEPADKSVGNRSITINKSRAYPFGFTGEEAGALDNGVGFMDTQTQEIAQAIRGITNEIEEDLAGLYKYCSRAYGTAGTTPFGSDLSDTAEIYKILADNGAPVRGGWNLAINTAAGAKMRTLTQLSDVNRSGDDSFLRQGTLLPVHNGMVKESAQIQTHTAGTASSATTDDSGYAVGATTITLASAGTGTILEGDAITFAGDSNVYIVDTGDTDVSDGGTIVLQEPGLRQAISSSATAITVKSDYSANMAFTPNAIQLAMRMPYLPPGGDAADERTQIVDPRSGLIYEFARYAGYHQVRYEVTAAWGVAMVKEEHAALLLG